MWVSRSVANAWAAFASRGHWHGRWPQRSLDHQGPGGGQQRGHQQRRAAERGRPGARGRARAAAAGLLAPQLLAQDARVGGGAQAAHVVVTRPSVLAVQKLVVADVGCRTRGRAAGRGEEKQNQFKFIW